MLRFSTERQKLRLQTKSPYITKILEKISSLDFIEDGYKILINEFINGIVDKNLNKKVQNDTETE